MTHFSLFTRSNGQFKELEFGTDNVKVFNDVMSYINYVIEACKWRDKITKVLDDKIQEIN